MACTQCGVCVQDPPMRTFSDYVMMSRLKRPDLNPSRLVPKDTFLDQIKSELGAKRRLECHFNSTVRLPLTSWKTAASILSLPRLPNGRLCIRHKEWMRSFGAEACPKLWLTYRATNVTANTCICILAYWQWCFAVSYSLRSAPCLCIEAL